MRHRKESGQTFLFFSRGFVFSRKDQCESGARFFWDVTEFAAGRVHVEARPCSAAARLAVWSLEQQAFLPGDSSGGVPPLRPWFSDRILRNKTGVIRHTRYKTQDVCTFFESFILWFLEQGVHFKSICHHRATNKQQISGTDIKNYRNKGEKKSFAFAILSSPMKWKLL